MSAHTSPPEVTTGTPPRATPGTSARRLRTLALIAVLMMVLGSLLARTVNTDVGATTVQEVTIFGASGHQISAYVYTPAGVSAAHPAPAIAMWHGLNNQKEYMSNTALELARRGFVVVSADQLGHGSSNGANQDAGCGGPDVLTYLRGLSVVDPTKVGLVGMSQGGFCAATAAALSQPDGYRSIFYMESEPTAPGSFDVTPYLGLHNIALNIGTWTEMGVMIGVDKGDHANVSPVLLPLFGTEQPIQAGKVYGSIADGTARILYTPWEEHALSTDSPAAIGNAIDWMQQTLTDGKGLAPGNQIWPLKVLGTATALAGAFLFLFAGGALLLRGRAFAGLAREVPEYRGLTGASWWIGALVTTAVGPLLYLQVWKHMFLTPALLPNALWPQTFTNVYLVWTVLVGVIAWAIILLNHRFVTARKGATLVSYGVAEPGGRIDWRTVGRSLLLVVATVAPVYVLLVFVKSVWHVDFRLWLVTLMPMSGARWAAFGGYLAFFAVYFLAQGIIFGGFLRWRGGTAPLWQEMLVNAVVLTAGALVWVVVCFGPLLAGGTLVFGSDPNSATSGGMGGISYLPLLVLWPVAGCLYAYFFRRTGRVWVGSALVSVLVVWQLAASTDFAFWPVG